MEPYFDHLQTILATFYILSTIYLSMLHVLNAFGEFENVRLFQENSLNVAQIDVLP